MIEEIIIDYLSKALSVPVYAEIPKKKSEQYIIVEKIAGGLVEKIKASSVSVYSYSSTQYKAAELDEVVRNTMLDIVSLDNISSCKVGGESRSNDVLNKEYRYETIFNLYHY